jgi:hypothetical protein
MTLFGLRTEVQSSMKLQKLSFLAEIFTVSSWMRASAEVRA